ncbi:Glycine/D-amino acid oxidase [Streptomyces sp. ScaeMP-e83]|uniref:NAD(P)/FAD-dependent oxidoreductase n=1 Tax=Streptomyces sp. SID4937 TaxID=2690280 RepID=UPI00081E4EEE|nr:FAD-binding oxidoreductase [Streptomyces sp. ScaeMP-e83]MYR92529.1 FAD-dependent oxidoreductase [Streptomyces sp. SID4937]SCD35341.1 Glycine/D-amino acid oxidase [Streptomyces sp. ScaeMP-e83]
MDLVVIGAGVVGAACAYYAAQAGLSVAVVDRGPVAGGTSGSGEGNLLVSDKEPGPELELARVSLTLWGELSQVLPEDIEFEAKGGLVVAEDREQLASLREFAAAQARCGVSVEEVDADGLHGREPHLAPGLPGGFHYPEDAQVQPARAAARLLEAAVRAGARRFLGEEVTAVTTTPDGRISGVRTAHRRLLTGAVVNAAGTWADRIAELAGSYLPVQPRRGFVLVTEPLPPLIRHKVYAAGYVADVASGDAELQTSPVVEGTPAGPVLIGASRERVGFDRRISAEAVHRLAAAATALFPVLAQVRVLRVYCGFRPYLPDHLPAIGPDPYVPGLYHACGHEGAGIGLAPATGLAIAQQLTGKAAGIDVRPFDPGRLTEPART